MATSTSQTSSFPDSKCRLHILMVLSIAVGFLGLDRIYNGQLGWGIVKLLTIGGLGVWWIIDAVYFTYKAGQSK